MSTLKIKNLLTELTGTNFYINSFSPNEGLEAKFSIVDSEAEAGGLTTYYVRILAKGAHPADVEALLSGVIATLNNKNNYIYNGGQDQLVLATCSPATPFYEGTAPNGEYLFSLEFSLISLELGGVDHE